MSIIDPQKVRSEHLEKVLSDNSAPWTLQTLELDGLRVLDHGQVRIAEHRAPADRVELYATRIKAGSFPPPLIVTKQGVLIDGNTRRAALLAAGGATGREYACYVVDVTSVNRMIQIGAQANEHGLPLSPEEKLAAVRAAVADGIPSVVIEARYGVSKKAIAKLVAQKRFDDKARGLGIDPEQVTTRATREIGTIDLDAPFKETLQLAEDTGMSIPDVKGLIKTMKEHGSEQEQLDVIVRERESRREQIAARAGGAARPRPSFSTQARSHYGWLANRSASELVELDPQKFWDSYDRARKVRDLMADVIAEFDSMAPSMPARHEEAA